MAQADARWDYDVFISYAHEDNLPVPPEIEGWVDQLERTLTAYLGRAAGDPPRIWRDPALERTGDLDKRIREHLTRSATLLCILSRSYVNSPYCMEELRQFLAKLGDDERVFKVVTASLPNERLHPPPLDKHIGYPYFELDEHSPKVYELDLSSEKSVRVYRRLTYDLARDMAERIQALRKGAAQREYRGTVYLARTSFDLNEQREAVRGELREHGFEVLPDTALPAVAADFEAAVRALLARSCLSVHLIGRYSGGVPDGPSAESYVELQHRLAVERAGEPGACLSRLVWIPPGTVAEGERQVAFLDRVRRESERDAGADWVQGSLEEFKALVLKTAAQASAPPPPAVTPPAAGRRIYLIHDAADENAVAPIDEGLAKLQYTVRLPVFEGEEAQRQKDHADALVEADVVLVYWGTGNEIWLNAQLTEIRKAQGYGRVAPPHTIVCVAPPTTPRKERRLRVPQVETTIAAGSGPAQSAIEAIAAAISGGAGAGRGP